MNHASQSRFDDRRVLVTGASRGIGEATARLFADRGADVVIASRKLDDCEKVASSIRAGGGRATAMALHIGDTEAVSAAFEHWQAAGCVPDILVNNAATNPYFGPLLDMPLDAFDKTVAVNLRGTFWLTACFARANKTGGGAVINVASVNARRPPAGQGAYSATKAALVNLTRGFARELAPLGIRVNAVLPGLVETKFAEAITSNDAILKTLLSMIPAGRAGQPEDIAPAIVWLASDEARYVTGTALTVDGGYLA